MTEQREKGGILFVNRQKQSDRSPDWTGTLTIGGCQYELAAWKRQGQRGGEFITLTAREPQHHKPPERRPTRAQVAQAEAIRGRGMRP